jgi:hypothetical protein
MKLQKVLRIFVLLSVVSCSYLFVPSAIATHEVRAGSVTAVSTGPTTASVSFVMNSDYLLYNATYSSYTATSSPGGVQASITQASISASRSGTINVSGLTPGTSYTFTVRTSWAYPPGDFLGSGTTLSSASSAITTTSVTAEEVAEQAAQAARAAAQEAAAKREAAKRSARDEILAKYKNSESISIELFAQAEIAGITQENIDAVQAEIASLPEVSREDITQVLKIARKYEVVGMIASDRVVSVYSKSLIEIGLIAEDNKHKAALTAAIKKLPASERSSYAAIKAAIDAEMAEIQARKDRSAAILARIAARQAG